MDISAALAADLDDLSVALDQPRDGLDAALHAFGSDARAAVRSYLGLTMTIFTEGLPFSLTLLEPLAVEEPVTASLLVPLPLLVRADLGSHLVLYAGRAGAFVDLAADLAFALDIDLPALPLDQHLVIPDRDGATGLSDISAVNQAIGVLIERGSTREEARAELIRAAGPDGAQGTVVSAAHRVIASIPPPVEPG